MRSLIDLFFSNIIPIIVVVSVVIRIFLSIKKAGDRKKEQAPESYKRDDEEEVVDVWSRLRPDEDDEDPAAAPPPLTHVYEQAPPEVVANPEPLVSSVPGEIPAAAHSPAAAFFHRINGLPPMRQAVILAEILGPPKGD